MLMMLGRVWGLRKKSQKPVQLMLMMLGRVWGLRQQPGAPDAHDAGPGLGASEKVAKASAADADDAGPDLGGFGKNGKSQCS